MADIGKINHLKVLKAVDFGLYLDAGDLGEILLPSRYVPAGTVVDDWLDVFIHLDSEDRLIATTETPKVVVGQCALLKVVAVNRIGAFLDWGLPKDLLVPFSEQVERMEVGKSYVVFAFLDDIKDRITGTMQLENHLFDKSAWLKEGEAVDLVIWDETELGFKAAINGTHSGLLYRNEVFQPLHYGDQLKGFIKAIREDGKIDLTLQLAPPQATRAALSDRILQHLRQHQGVSTLTDRSPPAEIYKTFQVSKGSYKKALGGLYKKRLIRIDRDRITLLEK
jgi:predicted RNA-binding protein (virulence factor B family)